MSARKMTRQGQRDFYANPENQTPQGPARRRTAKLTELVPVRFSAETIEQVRRLADADDRSVSYWIRRAVKHELENSQEPHSHRGRAAPHGAGRRAETGT